MVEIRIIKKKDDPMCTRISLGGTPDIGFYCVYRGHIHDVRPLMRRVLRELDKMEKEPEVSQDDGKEYT